MKKNFIIMALIAAIITFTATVPCYCQDKYTQVREALTKTYPRLFVGEIRESPIAGIYEFDAGPNVLYYYPEKNLLIFGEIWTKEGKSLTAERRDEIASQKIKDIPLDKAIRIGKGPNKVIEFTDPDCPFSRKASTFFKGREDVTRYVFFFPLPSHRDAEQKIRFILCSNEQEKSYQEVMEGKLDGKTVDTCGKDSVSATMREHKEIATKAGINGTPAFWVNGKSVQGANIPALEALLNQKRSKR